jgi:hypothetical protein
MPTGSIDGTERWLGRAGWVILLSVLLVAWFTFNSYYHLGYRGEADDYTPLALGHAFNIEYRLHRHTEPTNRYFQTTHPGIPFQALSWLAFRCGTLTYPRGADRILYTLDHSEVFLRNCKIAALLLTVLSLFTLARCSAPAGSLAGLSGALAFFSLSTTWSYSLTILGNETFALLGCLAFFGTVRKAFAAQKHRLAWWFLAGVVGGLVYLIKLNYIVWSLAVLPALGIGWWLGRHAFREAVMAGLVMTAGFCAATVGIGAVWLSKAGLCDMLRTHLAVVTHAGYYGNGDRAVVSSEIVFNALAFLGKDLLAFRFAWVALLVVLLAGLISFLRRRDVNWLQEQGPLGVALVGAFILGAAAFCKHMQPHYLIPSAAVLALMIIWVLQAYSSFSLVKTSLVLSCAIGAASAGYQVCIDRANLWAIKQSESREIAAIRSWPLGNREVRVWSYRVPDESSIFHFVGDCSGVPQYLSTIETAYEKEDVYYNIWAHKVALHSRLRNLDDFAWRYLVFNPKESEDWLRGMTTNHPYHITYLEHFGVIEKE